MPRIGGRRPEAMIGGRVTAKVRLQVGGPVAFRLSAVRRRIGSLRCHKPCGGLERLGVFQRRRQQHPALKRGHDPDARPPLGALASDLGRSAGVATV